MYHYRHHASLFLTVLLLIAGIVVIAVYSVPSKKKVIIYVDETTNLPITPQPTTAPGTTTTPTPTSPPGILTLPAIIDEKPGYSVVMPIAIAVVSVSAILIGIGYSRYRKELEISKVLQTENRRNQNITNDTTKEIMEVIQPSNRTIAPSLSSLGAVLEGSSRDPSMMAEMSIGPARKVGQLQKKRRTQEIEDAIKKSKANPQGTINPLTEFRKNKVFEQMIRFANNRFKSVSDIRLQRQKELNEKKLQLIQKARDNIQDVGNRKGNQKFKKLVNFEGFEENALQLLNRKNILNSYFNTSEVNMDAIDDNVIRDSLHPEDRKQYNEINYILRKI